MDRVATSTAYGAVLLNLMQTEARQNQIGQQLSTGQVATDLKGYGTGAEPPAIGGSGTVGGSGASMSDRAPDDGPAGRIS